MGGVRVRVRPNPNRNRDRNPSPSPNQVQRERERVLRALSDRSLRPAAGSETLVYGYHGPRYP